VKVLDNDGYQRVGGIYNIVLGPDAVGAKLTKAIKATITARTFTVIFDRNGADVYTGPQTIRVTEPASTIDTLPAPPSRTGYIFNGWNTAVDGSGDRFNADTTVETDITVYAQWIARSYTLSFNANGGDSRVPNAQTILFGQLAQPVLSPIDADQTFLGWNTRADGAGIQWDFARTRMPANDVVLYAQWSEPTEAPAPIVLPPAPTPPPTILQTIIQNILPPTPEPEPVEEVIAPAPTPTTFPPTDVPKAASGSWALLNLLLTLLSIALMAFAAASAATRKFDDEAIRRKRRFGFIGTALLALANVILFIATQSMFNNPMVLIDEYTIASALISIAACVATRFAFADREYNAEETE
jgi:uncharacterized repeat protein (TIGR02543 family)